MWGGHHVDLAVAFGQVSLQHRHEEGGGACRDVGGVGSDTIGCHHTRTRVALGRTQDTARLQIPRRIQPQSPIVGESARVLAGSHDSGEKGFKSHVHALFAKQGVILGQHVAVVVPFLDGEHTRRIANAQDLLPCQLVVDVARQRVDRGHAADVTFPVAQGLVEVSHAPAHRNIEAEQICQLVCGSGGVGIAPRAEGHKEMIVLIKCKVAVHHGGDAHGGNVPQDLAVFGRIILCQSLVAGLQALLYVGKGVCPEAVLQLILPLKGACGQNGCVPVHKHGFDAGGAKLDSNDLFHTYLFISASTPGLPPGAYPPAPPPWCPW